MFIVFEGIDGSGKTTISNKVAKRLRKRGIAVEHVREEGEFAQSVVRRLREFGKDRRNFELAPLPEILLYAAREAQVLADATRPALAKADVVFADRYLYSYEVLGCDGRGLPREAVRPILDAVAGGLWPDLVVLCDVDPNVARARRKASKIASAGDDDDDEGGPSGSRKGLGGVGVNHRVRRGYLALAEREPGRWLVLDNTFGTLDAVVERATEAVAAVIAGTPARAVIADVAARAEAPAGYRAARPTPAAAADAFYAFCAERAEREPGVVAYFLAGMTDARAWEHRAALADVVPDEIAYSIRGLDDEPAWALRERLAEATPFQVVKSVAGRWVDARRAHALRRRFADAQPRAVLSSLRGDVSEPAWALRRRLAGAYPLEVVGSLARDDGAEAWALRDALAARPGAVDDPLTAAVLARSLRAVAGERAWALRRRVFDAAPIPALASLAELADDDAWQWRERFAERAPKTVMGSLAGSEDPRAWALRGAHAERVKEAIDSMIGLDSDAAWALRARCEDIWPSTVLKSAIPLARTARAEALAARVLEHHGDNLSALKHGARFYAAVTDAAALEVVV